MITRLTDGTEQKTRRITIRRVGKVSPYKLIKHLLKYIRLFNRMVQHLPAGDRAGLIRALISPHVEVDLQKDDRLNDGSAVLTVPYKNHTLL
jgi:hypothetical protein